MTTPRHWLCTAGGPHVPRDRFDIGDEWVASEGEASVRALGSGQIAISAAIPHDDRDVAQVRRVAHRRLDPDFQRDADDHE